MSATQVLENIGEWTCERLAGQPARHAGPALAGRTRSFGLVFWRGQTDNPVGSKPLLGQLARCGITPRATVEYTDEQGVDAPSIAVRMNEAQVTSVLFLGNTVHYAQVGAASSAQSYFPEWLVSSWGEFDYPWEVRALGRSDQTVHLFGLTFLPRGTRKDDTPAWWATLEVDPSAASDSTYDASLVFSVHSVRYRDILLIASGIQMAGPHLTPDTFMRGLHAAKFPNPAHPIMAGEVGFADGDFSMTNDAAEWWWDNSARGPVSDDVGSPCYVDHGNRHRLGTWPNAPERFYDGPCDSIDV